MSNEHAFNCLQIKFSCQVHNSKIFIVEVTMFFSIVAIAFYEVIEHIEMGGDMALNIHRHET